MTIELSIPIESLTSEGVAQALAGLVLALGGHSGDTSEIGRRPSSPTTSWEEFHASLTPASQDFLALLRERGRVELEEAVEALGFKQAGLLPRVGYKDGAWRDVGYWALHLGGDGPPE